MALRPSLTLALLAVSEEVAELQRQGETVLHSGSHASRGEQFLVTDTDHKHGVSIFGFTDEATDA
jgi:hypothetical protein